MSTNGTSTRVATAGKEAQPLLELRDVTTTFGHSADATVANDRVSLRIDEQPPRLVSIVGESGSGKTTAARSLLGLQPPTSGLALWRGKDIYKLSRQERMTFRREVQVVFQDPYGIFNPYYPINRVFDITIKKFKLASSKQQKQELIEEALKAVNLRPPDVLGRFPHQLSGGERQRVMLARAYLLKPKVIVADEAISMLDVAVRAVIMNILMDFKEQLGISTIFITHDLSAAYYLGGDIMVMQRGRAVELGPSISVMEDPKHPYTKLLLESIPSPDPDKRWDAAEMPASGLSMGGANRRFSRDRCLFAERCPFVMEHCWERRPPLIQIGEQQAACVLYENPQTTSLDDATMTTPHVSGVEREMVAS
ncbi:MAG TPA: ABC transporter ATP-binding protein [Thermomicrobiales bacterium]|nr:ABC transporter ATP-binding protein [Thermomicrobiales bacterium]